MGFGAEAIAKTKRILDGIAAGGTLKALCAEVSLNTKTFSEVILGDSELALAYDHAKRLRADLDVDEMIVIADDTSRNPQQAKNAIDARKFRASKQYAQVYGDRIDVNVSGTVNIAETLSLARGRLLPRVEQDVIDVEVTEQPTLGTVEAKEDDIFS